MLGLSMRWALFVFSDWDVLLQLLLGVCQAQGAEALELATCTLTEVVLW